jgi:hypothetical protein
LVDVGILIVLHQSGVRFHLVPDILLKIWACIKKAIKDG